MSHQSFFIQNIVFDVDFFSKEKAYDLQNRISRLFSQRLSGQMEEAFDKMVPSDLLVTGDAIVLDIGTVSYDNFEKEVASKFETALLDFLSQFQSTDRIKQSYDRNDKLSVVPLRVSYLSLFENFLFTGTLPSYAAMDGLGALEKKLETLFTTDPAKLSSLITSAGQLEWVRKRLAYQFSERFIREVVELLEPDEAPFIITYKENVGKVHQQAPVVTSDVQSFHKELWVFILTFLLVEKGSLFSRKEFARSTFKRIAAYFNIAYKELLFLLQESIPANNTEANTSGLITLIHMLTSEELGTPVVMPEVAKDETVWMEKETEQLLLSSGSSGQNSFASSEEIKQIEEESSDFFFKETGEEITLTERQLRWLKHYLQHGSLPITASIDSHYQYGDVFLSLFRTQPREVKTILSHFSNGILQKRSAELRAVHLPEVADSLDLFLLQKGETDVDTTCEQGEPDTVFSLRYKEDLLYYFIRTGFLPWWASQAPLSLQSLLEEVYLSSPQTALQLLQWAGKEGMFKTRTVSQFHPSLLIKILAALPGGKEATAAFEQMLSIMAEEDSKREVSLSFIHLLWDNYSLHHYQRFDERLFYIQAVKRVAALHHISADKLLHPLIRLIEKKEIAGLQSFLRAHRSTGSESVASSSTSFVSEEEIITVILSQAGLNKSFFAPAESREHTAGAGSLIVALVSYIRYFFEHRSFPYELQKRISVSASLFCKAALLLLHKTAEEEAEKLISSYYGKEELRQLFMQWFSKSDYRENAILLWLNKLGIQQGSVEELRSIDTISTSSLPVSYFSAGEEKETIAGSLWLLHYSNGEPLSMEGKEQKAKFILHHFLTWRTLPQPEVSAADIPGDEILKEIVFLLFNTRRTALQTLLQNKTNAPEAVIRLAGLFITEKGGKEALVTAFLQPHVRMAALDYLWEEQTTREKKAADKKGPPEATIQYDVIALLAKKLVQPSAQNLQDEVAAWLDYFLTHNQLPGILSRYSEEEAVIALVLFLARQNTSVLHIILQKEVHHTSARMKMHDWIQEHTTTFEQKVLATTREALQRDIITYLQKVSGSLPQAIKNNLQSVWKSLPNGEKRSLLQAIVRHAPVREEWVKEVSLPDLYSVLKETHPAATKQYSYIITALTKLVFPVLQQGHERDSFVLHCKIFMLLILSGNITVNHPGDFVIRFFSYLDKRKPSFIPRLYQNLQQEWHEITEAVTIEPLIKKEIQKTIASRLSSSILFSEREERKTAAGIASLSTQPDNNTRLIVKESNTVPTAGQLPEPVKQHLIIEPGTKLHVTNAGLVLLHPFIPTYFTLTGLIEKNTFISNEAQQRAALLLQYAVFNTTEHEEQTLVLNKLLCGLPLEEPVPSFLVPTDKEIKITSELFTIIFQRWERMKNATAEGFRHSFLQRESRLTKGEKTWTLRVEQRGYDMMLQTLPWAFGLVKLPWMPLAIETEWI